MWVKVSKVVTVKVLSHQFIENLPKHATEVVRFLETYEIWVFFEENSRFWKFGKGGNFAVECVSNDVIHKNVSFQPELKVNLQKSEKF